MARQNSVSCSAPPTTPHLGLRPRASLCVTSVVGEQERKVAAAKMLQNGWRAYHEQRAKKPKYDSEGGGVPENSILNEPLFYKAALQYAQMRAESVNGLVPSPLL